MKPTLIFLAVSLTLVGCGDYDGARAVGDGGESGDATETGAPLDGGADTAISTPPLDANDSAEILARDGDGTDLFASASGGSGCYDEDAEACNPDTCSEVRSCCVGSGTCCGSEGADIAPSLVVPGCTDFDNAVTCIGAGVSDFGFPQPYIFGDAIVPGGDGDGDSGLLSRETVDLTIHNVTLTARFRQATGCVGGCVETVGVGMTTQSTVTGAVRVIASLLFSATRNRMTLMIGESQVDSWSETTDDSEWTLELQPSGTVRVLRGTEVLRGIEVMKETIFRPRPDARATVYGHSINPSSGSSPTRVEGLRVGVSLCDVPDAWTGRAPLSVELAGGGTLSAADGATAPSILRTASADILVWEQGGTILAARDDGTGFVATGETLMSANSEPWGNDRVGDPELIERSDGGFALFFTAHGTDRAPSIGRVDLDASLVRMGAAAQVVSPDEESAAWSQPTVWVHEPMIWVMVVNTVDANTDGDNVTTRRLQAMRSDDGGTTWTRHRAALLDSLTMRSETPTGNAFDADEIAHPSLSVHNGAWNLHYAGRRGTRTGLGLLVSDDLLSWRNPSPMDAILAPGANDFEQVSVSAPDILREPDGMSIVYVGNDGYQGRLAGASRRATDNGGF